MYLLLFGAFLSVKIMIIMVIMISILHCPAIQHYLTSQHTDVQRFRFINEQVSSMSRTHTHTQTYCTFTIV